MSNRWAILTIVMLLYLPVSVDATVLHVATPRLTVALGATGNEVLWIIDIYAFVMAGLQLPMGALGDRIGFKRLAMIGSVLFGLASLAAAMAPSAQALILARVALAVGGAMILPATVIGIRLTFHDDHERNIALGVWTAAWACGAAFGPLLGGLLLEYFYWGSVFLINLPIIAIALVAMKLLVPDQPGRKTQPWNIQQALVFLAAILLLVYAAKNSIRGNGQTLLTLGAALLGGGLLFCFVRKQLSSQIPMIDIRLLAYRPITIGLLLAATTMIAMVGFELLIAQELQFVHGQSAMQAGLFMVPLVVAAGSAGPLAGWLVGHYGLRVVSATGMALSTSSFIGLAVTDFAANPVSVMLLMVLLGLGIGTAQMAATIVVISSAPVERAGAAGSMEGMAYELGAGLGVALMGAMLTSAYTASIHVPSGLTQDAAAHVVASIGEAMQAAERMSDPHGRAVREAARSAYTTAHMLVLWTAAGILGALTLLVCIAMPRRARLTSHHI